MMIGSESQDPIHTTDLLHYITHLESTNASLTHTNSLLAQENSTLKSTVQQLETENEDQRADLLALEEEAEDLEDDVDYLMGELEELTGKIRRQTGKMKAIVQEVLGSTKEECFMEDHELNGVGCSALVGLPTVDGASTNSYSAESNVEIDLKKRELFCNDIPISELISTQKAWLQRPLLSTLDATRTQPLLTLHNLDEDMIGSQRALHFKADQYLVRYLKGNFVLIPVSYGIGNNVFAPEHLEYWLKSESHEALYILLDLGVIRPLRTAKRAPSATTGREWEVGGREAEEDCI